VAAPGRVNLIGEHTDYNDGFVLPMAIERYVTIAADRPLDGTRNWTLRSTAVPEPVVLDLTQPLTRQGTSWTNYVSGVVAGLAARGMSPEGLDLLIDSTVPLGGGLSSSAALEVATATLIEAVTGMTLDPVDKALVCQRAEHDFAGVPCGIMDQFTSALGQADHLLLLDCRSRVTRLVPMTDPSISVLIVNTNVRHELSGGEYAKRRAECEEAARALGVASLRDVNLTDLQAAQDRLSPVPWRRARHVVSEIARTLEAAEAIGAADWGRVGRLMYASHDSLRVDYEVSCAELDTVVELAATMGEKRGVIGCRMTGGGFGGCAVALVDTSEVAAISLDLAAGYRQRTGLQASIFVSRPAAGAMVLKA